jgi:hypothetical protein
MQKFVTVYVHSKAYAPWPFDNYGRAHGKVEEHLAEYLSDGWTIRQITGLGGMNRFFIASGWFGVVLEKPDAVAP